MKIHPNSQNQGTGCKAQNITMKFPCLDPYYYLDFLNINQEFVQEKYKKNTRKNTLNIEVQVHVEKL